MTVRTMLLGIALATSEPIRSLFSQQEPKPVVHVMEDVQCPPHFYLNIDERVWALRLR